jgi:hypothetical protein
VRFGITQVIANTWDSDRCFMDAAKLLYPADFAVATDFRVRKGRAKARLRMAHRYEGWVLLVSLASLATTADQARQQLAVHGVRLA